MVELNRMPWADIDWTGSTGNRHDNDNNTHNKDICGMNKCFYHSIFDTSMGYLVAGNITKVYKNMRQVAWLEQQMHQHFVDDPDMEHLLIDSTVIRAHPCAAGALKPHL